MPDPIGTYSPEAVIEAIEANLVGVSISLGRTEDGVVFRGSDVTWVYTGYPSLSRVLRARFTPGQAEDRVAEIFDCFREWDAPVSWVVGPTTFPPQLGDLLKESGFDAGEVWMGMARDVPATDLAADPPADPPAPGPGAGPPLQITRATTKADLEAWTRIDGDAGVPSGDGPADPAIFSPENAGGDPRCRYYLGSVDGRPVARGLAYLQEDVVGLHWLGVDPGHRGHGYRTALARRALSDARQTGSRLAVMPARGPVRVLGDRLGFKPYCQLSVHAWPPASNPFA